MPISMSSIKEFSKAAWVEVYNRIIGAVVFLDDASAECLHWDGGLFNLLNSGAVAVKTLSPFEICTPEQKKAVFITQVTATQLCTVKDIISNSDLSHCILISTVSLDVVFVELNDDRDVSEVVMAGRAATEATKQLEQMLQQWINKKQMAVEAIHIPISVISPNGTLFFMPAHSKTYPLYNGELIPHTATVDLYTLSVEERLQVRRMASALNSIFELMNLKEDVYYMGAYSSLIAGILDNSPVCLARRKNCKSLASLILVDRTLDMCGVTSHSSDSMLDRILSVLPKFPGHSTEVAVDMSPLCEANVISSLTEDIQLSPGCLYDPNSESCAQTYDNMINKSQKEVMFDIYNRLSSIDVQKSPGLKSLSKVTPQSVEKIVTATKGNYNIIEQHLGLLQQALAVVQTLKSPQHSQIEHLAALEKQVLQNIATSRESTSVLTQMNHLIKTRKDRNLPLNRLLSLLVHIYSLTGTEIQFSKLHEDSLTKTLGTAIFEDQKLIEAFDEDLEVTREQSDAYAKKVIGRLKGVTKVRSILYRYKTVLKPSEGATEFEYRGVLQQLIDDLLDCDKPEISDLRYRTEGIKDLLRTSLNILKNKKARSTKHPMDVPTVVIFVVGGITAEECKILHRAVISSGIDTTVYIGSTKLVTPVEAMKDVLLNNLRI